MSHVVEFSDEEFHSFLCGVVLIENGGYGDGPTVVLVVVEGDYEQPCLDEPYGSHFRNERSWRSLVLMVSSPQLLNVGSSLSLNG